ncbi:hypothetical protein LXM50_05615 [Microbacterium sp. Au-Mic1]|uniref:hypothetical protein n=1 Tax=Microbacterium sp. Au-Mic1 TaxID=2906457 RepID=UPI001E38E4B3|nr:hypothetical protein [Microbacterium sp. Au-Mic1]MCE4025445.1 hypothetical protein [Microbacterium sp. Au-Mic1]
MRARQTGDPMANTTTPAKSGPNTSLLIRGAIWIAIGALIAAALVCVVWVLIGDQQGLIGRAFLTIVLLAAFAAIAILEASLAPNREDWLALLSMISWILALLVGAVKIWLPDDSYFGGVERFFQLVLVVGILQLALLHVRLFQKAAARHVTGFTQGIVWATYAFLAGLVAMLVFYLTFPHTFDYQELYWRIVVALTILTAVGTMLIPLLNALFAPKRPAPGAPALVAYAAPAAVAYPSAEPQPWPTYADGRTPLPIFADGSPDWNAYYTGVPSPGATTPGRPAATTPVQPALPAQSAAEAAAAPFGAGTSAPQMAPAAPPAEPAATAPTSTAGGHGLTGALHSEVPAGEADPAAPSTAPEFPPAPPAPSAGATPPAAS